MKLSEYIKETGHEAASRLFGVSIWTIKAWRFGDRLPRPAKANEIVRITRGKVTLSEIYGPQPSSEKAA